MAPTDYLFFERCSSWGRHGPTSVYLFSPLFSELLLSNNKTLEDSSHFFTPSPPPPHHPPTARPPPTSLLTSPNHLVEPTTGASLLLPHRSSPILTP
ncbi:hypothetical protein HanIR_Chr06g0271591 [Helianthus annuus]|nr:hypothetical protein HanIR_Chr06g0271591 [Helianthus annuus]KAJ0573036.1 hypothetical protein HanHA89_Chr06g0222341 [Helianthus annuus]KAJ0737467.1 hypothetical protein HanLR1_Chr06g0207331 [Helianthus annuus]